MKAKRHPVYGKPQKGLPKGAPSGWLHAGKKKAATGPDDTTIRYLENDYMPEDYFGTDFR